MWIVPIIDDLTACMDDVNMLVFMDLFKYQISSKATIEQICSLPVMTVLVSC